MKVSLKRAHVLSEAALKAVKAMTVEPVIRVSIFESLDDADRIIAAADANDQKIGMQHIQALALITAGYTIREQLDHARKQHGISDLLNLENRLKMEEMHYRSLIEIVTNVTGAEDSAAALRLHAENKRERTATIDRFAYGDSQETVALKTVTVTRVAEWRRELARIVEARARTNEMLTVSNVTNYIMLATATVEALRQAELITDAAADLAGQG